MQAQFSKNKVGMADSMETISLALFLVFSLVSFLLLVAVLRGLKVNV